MEWGTPVWWGRFLLFCVPKSVKTKETNPTRPGSPTTCKQALIKLFSLSKNLRMYNVKLQTGLSSIASADDHSISEPQDKRGT